MLSLNSRKIYNIIKDVLSELFKLVFDDSINDYLN